MGNRLLAGESLERGVTAIQLAILDGFGDLGRRRLGQLVEIGDGAGDLENAVATSSAEAEALDGGGQ